MRFIIHEMPYEKPIAAGRLRYARDGQPTGALESWRLTQALEGYRVLRVDLDAREAASGHSCLYHLLLDENGRSQQLKFRFWGADLAISGQVLLEDDAIIATREVNGRRFEQVLPVPANVGFWFPSSIGLGLLAPLAERGKRVTAVSLRSVSGEQSAVGSEQGDVFSLFLVEVDLVLDDKVEKVVVRGKDLAVRPLAIRWAEQKRTIWLDEHDWPLKMERDDGLTAVETRYIHYQ